MDSQYASIFESLCIPSYPKWGMGDFRTLEADVESLTRMVKEFVIKTNPHISPHSIDDIIQATANSDISAIMCATSLDFLHTRGP